MKKFLLFSLLLVVFGITINAQPTGQLQQFFPLGNTSEDYFGFSVAIDGDYAVVGSYRDDDKGTDSGSAYVYKFENGEWYQMTKLSASDGAAGDYFGYSVSISGNYIIVGAPQDDDKGTDAGAAYIFSNSGNIWYEYTKLTGSNSNTGDNFGCAVAISWPNAVIGARYDDNLGQNSGTAFVFRQTSGWSQEGILTAPDGTLYDYFGSSVDIDGDYIIVGAYMKDGLNQDEGAAYIYKRIDVAAWAHKKTLKPTDLNYNNRFGTSVAISGGHAFVGAVGDDVVDVDCGAVYTYINNGLQYEFEDWNYESEIFANDASSYDLFGQSLSADGNNLLVGASFDDNTGIASGSAYLFSFSASNWSQTKKFSPENAQSSDYFANTCGLSGNNVIVGSFGDRDYGSYTGSSYFYMLNEGGVGNWGLAHKSLPENGFDSDLYGTAVTGNDNFMFVGVIGDDNSVVDGGALYIYEKQGEAWVQNSKYVPTDNGTTDRFGCSMSVYGDYLFVGAYNHLGKGAVYVLKNIAGTWSYYAKLTASDATAGDYFGTSVCADGDYVIVGAPGDDDMGISSGSVYIFYNSSGTWIQSAKFTASDGMATDYLGNSVAISGDFAVTGSHNDDDNGLNSGSAYIFHNSAGTWSFHSKIDPSDGAIDDAFGKSVSISGNYIIAGSDDDDTGGSTTGSAYIFEFLTANWTQVQKINANALSASEHFGIEVDINGNYALVGGLYNNAYLFAKNSESWSQVATLQPLDYNLTKGFSKSIELSNNYAFIGAPNSAVSGTNSGSAYVFGAVSPEIQSQPVDVIDACANISVSYTVVASSVSSYQWQISLDGGNNWNDVENSDDFSGAETFQLSFNGSAMYNNAYFRCYCSGALGDITSNQAVFSLETVAPVILSMPDTQSVSTDEGCNANYPDYTALVVVSDNCDSNPVIVQSPTPGTGILSSSNTVLITVIDDAGNSTLQTFTVLKVDDTDPYFLSTHNNQQLMGNALCEAVLPDYTATVNPADNCTETFVVTQNPLAGTVVTGSANTVTLSISDNSGNSATVSFNVAVTDVVAPVITSTHGPQFISATASCTAQLPDYTSQLSATDNCGGLININQSPVSGTWISGDINEVFLIASDNAGNSTSISFNVAVVDNSSPVISNLLADVILVANTDCNAILSDYTSSVIASDNCDNNLQIIQNPVAGTFLSGSLNYVSITVIDDAGNSAVTGFNVSVSDALAPVFTNTISNQIVSADANCLATMPDFTSLALVSDNCDSELTISQLPAAGTVISSYSNFTRLIATDNNGNSAQITFYTYIHDLSEPVITSNHSSVVLSDQMNCMATLPDYTATVIATDNCDPFLAIYQLPAAGVSVSGSDNIVTLQVVDDAGNVAFVSFNVAVEDNSSPQILSQHDDLVIDATNDCGVILQDYTSSISASDNCDENLTVTQNPESGLFITGQINQIDLIVTDGSGNSTSTSFNISIVDNTAPVIVELATDDEIVATENCMAACPDYTSVFTATDNCGNPIITQSPIAGTMVEGDSNTITIYAEDNNGFIAVVSFNLSVVDNEPPQIVCHENTTLTANPGFFYYVVDSDMLDPIEVSDNCEVLSYSNSFNNSNTLNGATIPVGETMIVWTVEDVEGNTSYCNCVVTVNSFVATQTSELNQISVYPNPSTGLINILGANNSSVLILDVSGRVIMEKLDITEDFMSIDLSEFAAGVYTINLIKSNITLTHRLVIEK